MWAPRRLVAWLRARRERRARVLDEQSAADPRRQAADDMLRAATEQRRHATVQGEEARRRQREVEALRAYVQGLVGHDRP